ncbi:MAG: outer membrane lipoprotein carrier protein LolA, partial [Proteobacteria bacterium]|nr:outer membrane lipoprotein carrier protein LolA [Pseudomonadota bacterium]
MNKRWNLFLILLACGWLFGVAAAFAGDASEVLAGVEKKYTGVTVMKADFVQTTRSALFGEEQQKGDVTLKRPSMMLWNFTNEKQFVTDGKSMWIYTKADNQVILYDDISGATSTADSLLQSLDRLGDLFDVSLIDGVDDGHGLS